MVSKADAGEAVAAARFRLGVSWARLAEAIDQPVVWTTAALLGQHPMSAEDASTIGRVLELDDETVEALRRQPHRGALETAVPTDPTIYRFYEVLQVYGPAIKELIHEEFGDGIMSAINFRLGVERVEDPAGDRVVVVLDGKFLPYQWLSRSGVVTILRRGGRGGRPCRGRAPSVCTRDRSRTLDRWNGFGGQWPGDGRAPPEVPLPNPLHNAQQAKPGTQRAAASGRRTSNRQPRPWLCTPISPLCASTSPFAIASPSPPPACPL